MFFKISNFYFIILFQILFFLISLNAYSLKDYEETVNLEKVLKKDDFNFYEMSDWDDNDNIIFSDGQTIKILNSKLEKSNLLINSKENFFYKPSFLTKNKVVFISKNKDDYILNIYSTDQKKILNSIANVSDYYFSNKTNEIYFISSNEIGIFNLNKNEKTSFIKFNKQAFYIGKSIFIDEKDRNIYYVLNSDKKPFYPVIYKTNVITKKLVVIYELKNSSSDRRIDYISLSSDNKLLVFLNTVGISSLEILDISDKKMTCCFVKTISGGEINGNPLIVNVIDKSLFTKNSKNIFFIGGFYNEKDIFQTRLYKVNIESKKLDIIKNTIDIRKFSISKKNTKIMFFQKDKYLQWNLIVKDYN
ncbi:MAG: hypothetical protein AABZ74_17320 [Cyanobacteriota bacterium]